jgi:hypothetical protein
MASPAHREFNCSICDNPVDLRTCKTDGNNKAVHEECYVLIEALKNATQPSASFLEI